MNIVEHNRSSSKMQSYILFCYQFFVKPKSSTEDNQRQEFILNIILIGSIILLLFLDISLIYNQINSVESYKGIGFSKFSIINLLFLFLYVLSRLGRVRLSTYILITLYMVVTTYSAYVWGINLAINLMMYIFIIIISGILVSSRFAVMMTFIISTIIFVVGRKEITTGILPEWKHHMVLYSDIYTYIIILSLITLISWLSNREIRYSLARARKSEKDLVVERDSLETKVQDRTQELKKAHTEKISRLSRQADFGRLSSGLFHDLVNPLSAISLNLDTIQNHHNPELSEAKEQIARAIKASRKLDVFISSIKKQIGSDAFREFFVLNEIIEEVISIFKYKSLKSYIEIVFEAESEISLFGNPIKFHQIVTNLTSNAIDALNEQTVVGRKIINITLKKDLENIEMNVIDNGIGIKVENLEKVFTEFFTTKSNETSMGLGLYTTKEIIVKEFEGTITVDSTIDEYTRFKIKIPYKINDKTNAQNYKNQNQFPS